MAKKSESKGKRGAPTLYNKKRTPLLAYNLMLTGRTDKEAASFIGVSEATWNNWKNKYPDFLESINKGREQSNLEVEQALRIAALGGGIIKKVTKSIDKGKKRTESEESPLASDDVIKEVIVEEEQPMNVAAAIFWLSNRDPERWKKSRKDDDEGNDKPEPPTVNINFS